VTSTAVLQLKHYTSIKGIALSSQLSNHNGLVCCVLTRLSGPDESLFGLANAEAAMLPHTQEKTNKKAAINNTLAPSQSQH